jgi:DNA-binding transcriptional LysR family regulator
MAREILNDLSAFVVVRQAGSFIKAAAQPGVSQSALRRTMRVLEERRGYGPRMPCGERSDSAG